MVGAYQLGLPVRLTLTGTRETRFAAARDSCFSFFDAVALAGFPERLGSLVLSDFFELLVLSGLLELLESDFFDWATRASSLAGRWGSGLAAGPAGT